MKIIPLFTITIGIITFLMAKSCGASVCHTFNVPAGVSPRWDLGITIPTGTTDIVCNVECSATDLLTLMFSGTLTSGQELIVDQASSCGTTMTYTPITTSVFSLVFSAQTHTGTVITCNCNGVSPSAPSPAPSAPSPAPSAPTPAATPPPVCFSGEATVEQPGQAPTKMTELNIGDKILTANDEYQPIYAFAHNDDTTYTEFLQIHTTSGNNPLEITSQHLVYVQGKDAPVTAGSIKVGDSLTEAGQGGAAVVTKIDTVKRHGLYAPLTPDGTLVVDGIASSCYVSLQPNGDPQTMEVQGHSALSVFSHHRVAHMLLTVPRLVCMGGINPKWCQTYNEDGVALFVQTAFDLSDWFHAQHWMVQYFLLAVYLVVLCPLYALELLFGAKMAVAMVVGGLGFVGFVRGNNAPAAEPTDVNKQA